ncbi:MAG: hypothetical protein DSZ23_04025, partial [Thermodesulfatator sp.]
NRDFLGLLQKNRLKDARDIWNLKDESVKKVVSQRSTGRVFLESPLKGHKVQVYIKRYTSVPLKSRIKDMFSLKFFQFDAIHEWQAQIVFHRLELPTVIPIAAGKLECGTFNLTLAITNYKRASKLLKELNGKDQGLKNRIIENIATYVGRMHGAGLAHQDLYLVHFFLRGEEMVPHLIDLQRVIKEKTLSDRWRIKDLGELLFSARELVSDEDISHFCRIYSRVSGFNLMDEPRVIKAIEKKAAKIKARHERKHSGHQEKN